MQHAWGCVTSGYISLHIVLCLSDTEDHPSYSTVCTFYITSKHTLTVHTITCTLITCIQFSIWVLFVINNNHYPSCLLLWPWARSWQSESLFEHNDYREGDFKGLFVCMLPPESRLAQRSPSAWTAGSSVAWPADPRYWWPHPRPKPEPDDWTKAEGTASGSYDAPCEYIKQIFF